VSHNQIERLIIANVLYALFGFVLCVLYGLCRPNCHRDITPTTGQVKVMVALLLLWPVVLAYLAICGVLEILRGDE
jgi:hypothetical protein